MELRCSLRCRPRQVSERVALEKSWGKSPNEAVSEIHAPLDQLVRSHACHA